MQDEQFIKTVLKSGTTTDRVSALTLIIQESPFHALDALAKLMQMVQKKSRRECLLGMDTVKDLFISALMPKERALAYFSEMALTPHLSNKQLALFYFEHVLKSHFAAFVLKCEQGLKDLDHVKNKSLYYLSDLLTALPEQEEKVLQLLVNKLVCSIYLFYRGTLK